MLVLKPSAPCLYFSSPLLKERHSRGKERAQALIRFFSLPGPIAFWDVLLPTYLLSKAQTQESRRWREQSLFQQ